MEVLHLFNWKKLESREYTVLIHLKEYISFYTLIMFFMLSFQVLIIFQSLMLRKFKYKKMIKSILNLLKTTPVITVLYVGDIGFQMFQIQIRLMAVLVVRVNLPRPYLLVKLQLLYITLPKFYLMRSYLSSVH